jgi:hypothetical protein
MKLTLNISHSHFTAQRRVNGTKRTVSQGMFDGRIETKPLFYPF